MREGLQKNDTKCFMNLMYKIKTNKARTSNELGQALVEFLFISVTFVFVILGVIQLALSLNAYAMVRYAAYNAARAAIVHGGDEQKMLEAARISLLPIFPKHGRADHPLGVIDNYVAAQATDQNGALTFFEEPITQVSILGKDHIDYGQTITFDDPRHAKDAYLTIQVVHQYELVIPLVRRIVFWVYMKAHNKNPWNHDYTLNQLSKITSETRKPGRSIHDIEYRIPLVAHYTMHLQSDFTKH